MQNLFFYSQSQFRFDNECYLNLPDNHKRVSLPLHSPSFTVDTEQQSTLDHGTEENTGTQAITAKESNFNLVCDDFNIASVSMPVFISFFLFYFNLFLNFDIEKLFFK
jgi:hypothetical protein